MRRGEFYRVRHPSGDPKRSRVFVIVSRDRLIASAHRELICAPVLTKREGLSTQVPVGPAEGLKHDSAIHCDGLSSVPRNRLTDYVGELTASRMPELNQALAIALDLA
jgi:mRNA interferase MazF